MGDLCDAGCRAADGVTRASHPAALHTIKAAVSPGHTAQLSSSRRGCGARGAARLQPARWRRSTAAAPAASRGAPAGLAASVLLHRALILPRKLSPKRTVSAISFLGSFFFLLSWLY